MKTRFSNYGLNLNHTTDITWHQQRAKPQLEDTATIRNIITIMMITFVANTSTNVLPNLTKAPQAFCLQLVLFLLSPPSSPAVTLPSIMDRSTISLFFQIFHFGFCMFLNVSWHVTALEFGKSFTPVRLQINQFYPRKMCKSRNFSPKIGSRECFTHLFWTNWQFLCAIIYSNKNSLKFFCKNSWKFYPSPKTLSLVINSMSDTWLR